MSRIEEKEILKTTFPPITLQTWLLSCVKPQIITTCRSAVNGHIQVVLVNGQTQLRVQGAIQVGDIAQQRLSQILQAFKRLHPRSRPQRALILGFGGGNFATLLKKSWPKLVIIGVELDPQMVELGNRYFQASALRNTQVVVADAFRWIDSAPPENDLILIDLYRGFTIPQALLDPTFLKKVQRLLSPSGKIILNYYASAAHPNHLAALTSQLKRIFPAYRLLPILGNHIFYLS